MDQTIEQTIQFSMTSMRNERQERFKEHQQLARYVRPELCDFFEDGQNTFKRPVIEQLWDDTAIKANDVWARGVNSMAHGHATDWFKAQDQKDEVNADGEASAWYGMVNDDLRTECRESGLYLALLTRLKDVGAFGWGVVYSYDDNSEGRLTFEWIPPPESYFTLNRKSMCNRFGRRMYLTARQIKERGIDLKRCDTAVQNAFEQNNEQTRFHIWHFVIERKDLPATLPERANPRHEFIGFYYQEKLNKVVQQHGFYEMPYHVLCWNPVPQSPYSIGIGYITLPEIRNLNAQRKKFDRLLDKESDSPILRPDDNDGHQQSDWQAGENIYGGMTGSGTRLYDPLFKDTNGSRSIMGEVENSRQMILDAWQNPLMLMVMRNNMTATEVNSIDEKIIQAMGPFIIPMMADLNGIMDRLFHSRMRRGAYDPLPGVFDEDTEVEIELLGILAKAHKKLVANNITMFYGETIATVGAVAPDRLAARIDHDKAIQVMGDARALPSGIILSDDQVEERMAQQQQAAQQQQMIEAAPGLAAAAKDAASAVSQLEASGNGQTGPTLAP